MAKLMTAQLVELGADMERSLPLSVLSGRSRLVAGLACFGLLAGTAHAQLPTTNLLTNSGAETGDLTGWTVGGTSNPGVDNGSFDGGIDPHTGNFDFYGGTGPSGTLSQTVSLVGNQGITAALIDSGALDAQVSFWEQGLNQGDPSDDANITLTFFNGSSTAIGTITTDTVDSHLNSWTNFTGNYAVPVGARSVTYTMNFLRNSGSDNDSFIDDNSLIVSAGAAAAAPEPSGIVLSAFGLSSVLGGCVLRCRRR